MKRRRFVLSWAPNHRSRSTASGCLVLPVINRSPPTHLFISIATVNVVL